MAKKTKKLTTFKSSESVVTENYMNSIYGGLHGTEKESLYNTTDPLIGGHVHDGERADGHAQKINLGQHVTGFLPQSMIEGTLDGGSPGSPLNSFQFNSSDTFAGSPSFLFQSSTDNLQLSKDKRFYYGSIDNQNSFYIGHEIETNPELLFSSESTSDSVFYKFRTETSNTTDIVLQISEPTEKAYFYGESTNSGLGGTRYFLGNIDDGFFPWYSLYTKSVILYPQNETINQKHVTLALGSDQVQDYVLLMPIYRTAAANMVLKTVTSGASIKLTWDSYSSGGGASFVEGQNINIVNDTIETESSVLFNTVESGIYYVGTTDVSLSNSSDTLHLSTGGSETLVLNTSSLHPYADQGMSLGETGKRFSSLNVDDVIINENQINSTNTTDLVLQANSGTNGSSITLGYSSDNTTDVIIQTKGIGRLESPYHNVMSEGQDGGRDSRTTFINNKVTTEVQFNYSFTTTDSRAVLSFYTFIDPSSESGCINLEISASLVDRSGATDLIGASAYVTQKIAFFRQNSGGTTDFTTSTLGTTLDSTNSDFISTSNLIDSIYFNTISAFSSGFTGYLAFSVGLNSAVSINEVPYSCDFLTMARVTHTPGVTLRRG